VGRSTIDEIKPTEKDHVVIKRRDSAFQDTELRVWLQSARINTLIFCGVTSICVETSLRDGFNMGYDVILIADATASAIKKHYDATLERVRDYYGIVTHLHELKEIIKILEQIRMGGTDYDAQSGHIGEFLEKHNLIDKSKYQVRSLSG
jgi:ureidoacrylate peracid hydrolase